MEKTKQYVAMIGGVLGALLLFFQALGFQISWFNTNTIDAFLNFLLAAVPLDIEEGDISLCTHLDLSLKICEHQKR